MLQVFLCYYCRGLCDMNNSGRLNGEQFCLAMYLINQKVGAPISLNDSVL